MIRKIMLVTVFCATYAASIHATQVFTLEGIGAISRAMGGTAAAFDIGAAGMVSNPATLDWSENDGTYFMVGADLITTNIEGKNFDTGQVAPSRTNGNNRGPYFAPQFAVVHKSGKLSYGLGVFANGGIGTEYGIKSYLSEAENGYPTGLENSSRLLVLRMPLSSSFRINDKLTLGASIDVVWTSLNLELLMPSSQVGALAAGSNLTGSLVPVLAGIAGTTGAAHFSFTKDKIVGGGAYSVGLGGRLGFTYRLNENTVVGGAYNLETNVGALEGRATLTALDGNGLAVPLKGDIKLHDFEMPASIRLGLSHQMNKKLLFAFDYQRVYWSDVMKSIDVSFKADVGGDMGIVLPHNYSDINIYSLGAAYQYNQPLTLRAGFSYADNPIPAENLLAVVPAYLTKHVSIGLSYKLGEKSVVDLAYSHAFENKIKNNGYLSTGAQQVSSHSQNNFVLSYTFNF
jgi:long-chain fatty acid transport protein